jgi:hypothetical protein
LNFIEDMIASQVAPVLQSQRRGFRCIVCDLVVEMEIGQRTTV